ncbi:hypothetical protein RG47T_2862 [Mucilaginibacter polytrichastri]|uniref:Bulb-type lectin domain-containing protein n=2 Tax=Mucilaginibacter polytrichastri TaxID=1302689 RepID=A0A1Q6A088_9SPHI|nr:hypothetical protein RG47T_2862 [Mucilaginibacter polytrichastri]
MYALFDQYMNIIIYAAGGEIWRTNGGAQAAIPPGPGGPYFYWVVQNDGNFVVYYNIPGFPADSKSTNTAGGVVTKHNHQIR